MTRLVSYDQLLRKGLTFETCACGWRTSWGSPDAAHKAMRQHRLGCMTLTQRDR